MDNREFYGKLKGLVLPIAFQQFMTAVVSASDAVMLGRLSQDSMAAVSLAAQVQFVFSLYLAAMTIGASMFAAQYWGRKDRTAVEKIQGMVLLFMLPVSLAFTAATALFPQAVMRIFTPDQQLIANGAQYLQTVSLSYLLCGVSQVLLCIMKNCGGALKSSLISSACVALNIVLNAVLIFGLFGLPAMGVAGAAAATVLSRLAELLWAYQASRGGDGVRLRAAYILRLDKKLKRDFFKYVLPVLGNEIVWGVGFTMSSVIMGHLGSDAVAANAISGIARNLMICLCMGLGSAGGILVGNELGAGRLQRARQYGDRIVRLSIAAGAATGLALLAVSPVIVRMADLTEQAGAYLQGMFFVCTYYCIGKSVNCATIGGIFCAGGDSKFGFICDAVTLWCITVPLGLLAAFVWKLPVIAVYVILCMDEMIKLPAVYRNYRKYKWIRDLTGGNCDGSD